MTRAAPVAAIRWRRLDGPGEDTCRLFAGDGEGGGLGWMMVGHARFGETALDYVVHCDPGWRTTAADVSGHVAGAEVGWHIARDAGGWRLDDARCPGLEDAVDVDLAFTPATNLMPVRRLVEGEGSAPRAAWFRWPEARLEPLDQTYDRVTATAVAYSAAQTGFFTTLTVDATGFVTCYPGCWLAEGMET